MILPLTVLDRKEHQSVRPQGLVLREALEELERPVGKAKQVAFDVEALEGQLCEISISHDGDFASSVALVPSMMEDGAR